ncbi:mRNA cap enzyme, DSPc and/or DNA ligase A M domain containing protein [Asbolus verrucosus]|uniref:mRNA-capping enzyme n=1 Tax=Asbolus verrucosus TaxID=1661398 RepID=A0A482W0H8_ASBVE|nr:mRNA cap enzyme, DSPc and/or DNA ligase A M domain containing protein [Asbolus verrucosus]
MSRKSQGPIPNRWMYCPRKAADLIVGQFMAFKTPLSTNYDKLVPPECRFPPKMLFDLCKTKKIKFGLWIDLTNTNRFYDKEEVESEGCKYIKLQCRGHGETPSTEQTNTFIQLVHNFITKHPLEKIAVHCTHGFNRTGFLIVSYLVEKMDFDLKLAIETFGQMRPPGIYKSDYLAELYNRYDDVEDTPPAPDLPDWCFDNNGTKPSYEEPASSSNYGPLKKSSSNATFMDGVPGVTHYTRQPKAFHLQKKVQIMCEWQKKGFPGCQPVSMDINNIQLLHQKPYRVSWKADGTRYMMLIDGEDEIYFFDRDHNVFKVDGLTFPHRKNLRKHLENTLLDGVEMVIDKVNGEDIPRYLAYDIVKFEGQDVGKTPFFPTRLHCLENEIIKPRYLAMENGLINKTLEPFSVRKKDFWEVTQAASLLGEKFARTLSHEPDGLIFQPSKEPYMAGRCDEVLKWKPLDMNSVDFRLKIVEEGGEGKIACKMCFLYVGQLDTPFAKMKYTKPLKNLDNRIIECKFEDNQWKFMRERTDKSFPNSFNTAKAVCGSIQNPITKEKLLSYIDRYRFDDDTEVMPPPSKMIRR